ncbi:unnamed protein product [Staurois parvus]|uniref:Uncharacterized protein n=1 Tax=Staurois parvus TaxID=386267 RepID=A0ABN9HHY7_9NEOB|nr:unnamed protein product [Staurois parvus]
MEHTSSVRRPESGTWHGRVWRWRQQQWEAVQGPMRDSGPGSSMRRRYRGPWQIRGPGSSNGRPVICQHPMTKIGTHQQCVRRPESGTWQSVAMETAAMGGRYRDP